jgi:lambda repressor-like predicted transcriptional regulator
MDGHMSNALKPMPALERGQATMAAALIAAYVECSEPIRAVVAEMAGIITSPESSPEDVDAASNTLYEALFPGRATDFCELDDRVQSCDELRAASDDVDREQCEFATRVRAFMDEQGLTQADLAKAAGISQPAVNNILNRNCRPQRRTVIKFALALGVEPHDLWPAEESADPAE